MPFRVEATGKVLGAVVLTVGREALQRINHHGKVAAAVAVDGVGKGPILDDSRMDPGPPIVQPLAVALSVNFPSSPMNRFVEPGASSH